MSATLNNCRYNPNGTSDLQPIPSLDPLLKGELDITRLLHTIVTKDFGYTGKQKYTLTLRNNAMVLDLLEGSSKKTYGTIEKQGSSWTRTKNAKIETMSNGSDIGNRIRTTLHRIHQAHQKASSSTKTPENCSCGSQQEIEELRAMMEGFSKQMRHLTSVVERGVARLPHDLSPKKDVQEQVEKLARTTEALTNQLEGLRRESPEELLEIRQSIQNLHSSLSRLNPNSSENVRSIHLSNMESQIRQLKDNYGALSNQVQEEIALKDRKITILSDHIEEMRESAEQQDQVQLDLESLLSIQRVALQTQEMELATLREQLAQKTKDLIYTDEELKSLKKTNSNQLLMTQALETDYEQLSLELSTEKEKTAQTIRSLEVQLQSLKSTQDNEKVTHKQEELLAKIRHLESQKSELVDRNEHLAHQTQALEKFEAQAQSLLLEKNKLKQEVESLHTQVQISQERIQTLLLKNRALDQEKQKLANELGQEHVLVETACKVIQSAAGKMEEQQKQIEELRATLQSKDRQIIQLQNENSQLKKQNSSLSWEKEEALARQREADQNAEHFKNLRDLSARENAENRRKLEELENEYRDFRMTSNELESLLEEEIARLKEELNRKLLTTPTSTGPIAESIKALEEQRTILKTERISLQQLLPTTQQAPSLEEDDRASVSSDSQHSVGADSIAREFLNQIQDVSKEQHLSYKKEWLGPILVNLAVLSGIKADEESVSKWIKEQGNRFPDAQGKTKNILAQLKTLPTGATQSPVKNNADTVGKISKTLEDFKRLLTPLHLMQAFSLEQLFKTTSCAYIALELLKFERSMEPLLNQYKEDPFNKATHNSKGKRTHYGTVVEARNTLKTVKELKDSLRIMLGSGNWILKA